MAVFAAKCERTVIPVARLQFCCCFQVKTREWSCVLLCCIGLSCLLLPHWVVSFWGTDAQPAMEDWSGTLLWGCGCQLGGQVVFSCGQLAVILAERERYRDGYKQPPVTCRSDSHLWSVTGSVTASKTTGIRSLVASSAVQSQAKHFTQPSVNRKSAVGQRIFCVFLFICSWGFF